MRSHSVVRGHFEVSEVAFQPSCASSPHYPSSRQSFCVHLIPSFLELKRCSRRRKTNTSHLYSNGSSWLSLSKSFIIFLIKTWYIMYCFLTGQGRSKEQSCFLITLYTETVSLITNWDDRIQRTDPGLCGLVAAKPPPDQCRKIQRDGGTEHTLPVCQWTSREWTLIVKSYRCLGVQLTNTGLDWQYKCNI